MTGGVAVICRPELAPGFVLAGVETAPARDPGAAEARLAEMRDRADLALVLLEESLLEGEAEEGLAAAGEGVPVVVPFPGALWAPPEEPADRVLDILRRAVGYRVRLG